MPPSNFVVLADPSAFLRPPNSDPPHLTPDAPTARLPLPLPATAAAVLNAFAAFVHTHINPSALWGFRLLSSPPAAPPPALLPLSSGFAHTVTEHITHPAHVTSISPQAASASLTLGTITQHLVSIAGPLSATVHLSEASGTAALSRVAVSPARTGRQRLAATVSVRNVILVLAPFPSTIEQAHHFFKDSLDSSQASLSTSELADLVSGATSHLVQSAITASLLSCGTIVHWLHPFAIADQLSQAIAPVGAFAAALGGVFASIFDLDLSLPLPLLFSGLTPANVHIPSVLALGQEYTLSSSAHLSPSIRIASSFKSESTRVPVAPLHSGPFPRGPWWPVGRFLAHSLLLAPVCHELAHSIQLAVCLQDLPRPIPQILADPLQALLMQARSPHSDGVDHYATVVRMSERFSLFNVLEAQPPVELMEVADLGGMDAVEDMEIDSHPVPESMPCIPPILDPFLGLVDFPPPDSHISTQLADDYEFDYDCLLDALSTLATVPHVPQAGLFGSEPATPRVMSPPTPRRTQFGMTPARTHSSSFPMPELMAFLSNTPETVSIDHVFLAWYRILLYMPSACVFANLIDVLPRIRTRLFDNAEFTGKPIAAILAPAILPPSSLSAKLRAVKLAAHPQSSSQADDSQDSQSDGSNSQQLHTPSLAPSDRPLRSGLSLARAQSFSVVPSALAAAPKKRKLLGRAVSTSTVVAPPTPVHVLPADEVDVIHAHADLVNLRSWLHDYQLREIMVQIVFHFELMLSVLDTTEQQAVTSDPTASQCKSAIETYLSKLQLLTEQDSDQTRFPTRGSVSTPRRSGRQKSAATPRSKAGADTRLRKWIEQTIVFHYHDHAPEFVTQLYQQHGGDMEAYVNATANPFSPKLAKAAAAPSSKTRPSASNDGTVPSNLCSASCMARGHDSLSTAIECVHLIDQNRACHDPRPYPHNFIAGKLLIVILALATWSYLWWLDTFQATIQLLSVKRWQPIIRNNEYPTQAPPLYPCRSRPGIHLANLERVLSRR
ncbi:hypothetical protein BCR44DRAFT_1157958 [Catenaria anguillulae PL171]|uniref:Uncharacterized protein n=1 Tax=Catenaria anguillulae PL171 TaxID=765915 RepID=A0A1Y2HIG3_9FUNG|nr:hypothetical protein BCR44DRAFT_1157958 [Catenaria anguillulae PL171]